MTGSAFREPWKRRHQLTVRRAACRIGRQRSARGNGAGTERLAPRGLGRGTATRDRGPQSRRISGAANAPTPTAAVAIPNSVRSARHACSARGSRAMATAEQIALTAATPDDRRVRRRAQGHGQARARDGGARVIACEPKRRRDQRSHPSREVRSDEPTTRQAVRDATRQPGQQDVRRHPRRSREAEPSVAVTVVPDSDQQSRPGQTQGRRAEAVSHQDPPDARWQRTRSRHGSASTRMVGRGA
jgi:hypothetical protein